MNIKLPFNVEIGSKLTLIGGPCVAENWEICCEIATYLKELCQELDVNYIFKASYDKANRSSHKSFRGPGMEEGLEILAEIRQRYNVPVLADVHSVAEVDAVAKVITKYIELRKVSELFADTFRRVGIIPFKEVLYETYEANTCQHDFAGKNYPVHQSGGCA